MNIIDEMANDAVKDKYFLRLFHIAEQVYWNSILCPKQNSQTSFTPKELDDILTFADILSLSSEAEHRNLALKILSCLKEVYNSPKYQYFAKGIMIRLGNFPGYKLISKSTENNALPLDISIEKEYKEIINKDQYSEKIFTDAQYNILEELQDKNHFSFSGPTSFGKSFILTSFIKGLIINNTRGLNIVYLVPTRALVSQTVIKLKSSIEGIEGYCLSSSPDIPLMFRQRKMHYIFVFTPERLIHYFANASNPSIEYLFIDEAQKVLSDDPRSVVYYHAISLAERKSCKLFFSSPNIQNVDIFLRLFNKTATESQSSFESPVCQARVFIDMIDRKIRCFSDTDTVVEGTYTLPTNLPELIETISRNVDSVSPKSLIYCNTIEDTIDLAEKMANHLKGKKLSAMTSESLRSAAEEIAGFIHQDYYLVDLIKHGVGFHFGKLPQRIRDIVEKLYDHGELQYLFCTSTLLEGVNLPAQNIFILNNQIGNRDLNAVDFWNLAGRAGRLAKELCGNVFCIKWTKKEGRWTSPESIEIIRNKRTAKVDADLITGHQNFYKNILNAAQDQPFSRKNISETQRRVYNAYSNVLIAHFAENQPSLLRNEFQIKIPEGVKAIIDINKRLTIPSNIISRFPLIKVKYQNRIWCSNQEETPILSEPTYDNCLLMLERLCDLYNWDVEESGGRNPLLPRGDHAFLKHYASLMADWMNSKSINQIINQALYSKRGKTIDLGYLDNGAKNIVLFNPQNRAHINRIINKTISEIDTIIRFTLKTYFENYCCIINEKYGTDMCGQDWALYLEHGTTKKQFIEIQKIGIPRHLSKLFYDDFGEFCIFDDAGDLQSMNQSLVYDKLKSKKKPEYTELTEVLTANYILGNKAIDGN